MNLFKSIIKYDWVIYNNISNMNNVIHHICANIKYKIDNTISSIFDVPVTILIDKYHRDFDGAEFWCKYNKIYKVNVKTNSSNINKKKIWYMNSLKGLKFVICRY